MAVPSDWTFVDPEREDRALISKVVARGPCWRYWERTSAWHSKFKGYYAPRSLVEEERQKLTRERGRLLQGRKHETLNLAAYEVGDWQKEGVSALNFGRIPVPEGWDLLESGDALLTRRVKARGKYWEYYHELKTKPYDKKIGIFAPANIIEGQRRKISRERGTKEYEQRLQRSRRSREKKEAKYRE